MIKYFKMTLSDLFFLASLLLVLSLLVWAAVLAVRKRCIRARNMAGLALLYVFGYAAALMAVALTTPRRMFEPGQRRCFDDWCVAGLTAEPAQASDSGTTNWIVSLEVSSDAKRIRQRASDAVAELEDRQGHRYAALPSTPPALTDELGPGESFRVRLPFRLPVGASPVGVVISHGTFPGILVLGEDQSFLHRRTLMRVRTIGAH